VLTGTGQVPRRRRYGAALEEALLDAAWDELGEIGYAGFTVDAVARRAGTSRPVLYRRWPSRARLVLAASERMRRHCSSKTFPAPDSYAAICSPGCGCCVIATIASVRRS